MYELGRIADAQAELARLHGEHSEQPNVEWFIGTAHAWMGSTDEAFEYLEVQREKAPGFFNFMANSPLYDNLRDDPRWLPLLESVNLDPESRAAVKFDPTLPPDIRLQ